MSRMQEKRETLFIKNPKALLTRKIETWPNSRKGKHRGTFLLALRANHKQQTRAPIRS
jgi:hypothetical protein